MYMDICYENNFIIYKIKYFLTLKFKFTPMDQKEIIFQCLDFN